MKFGDIFGAGEVSKLIGNVVDRVLPDKVKLAELDLEQLKLEMSQEFNKMANETKLYEIEVDDRKSARTMHTSFVDFLAVVLMGGCGFLIFHIMTKGLSKDIDSMVAGMIIQAILSIPLAIIAYYFGSSSGSKAKNDAIAEALKK